MTDLTQFDEFLKDGVFAAFVLREVLEPVEGPDAVFFPATYAAAENRSEFSGGYNIDTFPDGSNVCLVDSVGSQANRLEAIFAHPPYYALVPQIRITFPQKAPINLLNAGHRAGDAVIRFTKAGETLWHAFMALQQRRNAAPLAKIAPTSLVFGVWDSRGTQEKVPRALRSVIRAFNVRELTRSAQFNRAAKFVEEGYLREDLDVGDGDKNPLSREGFKDNPATRTHGGVLVNGEIRREVTINLAAIRRLHCTGQGAAGVGESNGTLGLRRYIFGLAIAAATSTSDDLFYLREGCELRRKPGDDWKWRAVAYHGDDRFLPELTSDLAVEYAKAVAAAFGVGESGDYAFDKPAADKWLALKKEEQDKRRRLGPMTQQFDTDQAGATTAAPSRPGRRGRTSTGGDAEA